MSLALAHGAEAGGDGGPTEPSGLEQTVDGIAARTLARPGAAGLSIAVGRHGAVLLAKGYGVREITTRQPVEADTVFHGCSTSKQFAAAAALRLAERGQLSLDDPLSKHLPDYHVHDRPVLLRHLLNHTSGLPTYDELPAFGGDDRLRDIPHAQITAMFQDEPCDFAPGEQFAYTNSGFFLIGEIVERVSGKPWGDFLRDELTAPLGLKDTLYDPHPRAETELRMAVGYTLDHGKLVEAEKIAWSNAFCAGGNLTTAHDLVTWSMAVASGKVVSPASYVRMATPTTWPDGDCSGYGFGLWIDPDSTGAGHDRTWHTGHGPGYTAAIVNYSRDELAIAVMSNSDAIESMELVDAIAVSLLGLPEPRIEDQMLPTERVREFVGTYQNARTHRSVTISEAGGHLAAKPDKLPTFTLMWQGGERFVLKEDPRTEIQFMLRGPGAAAGGQSPFRTIVRSKGGIHESAERRD